MILKEIAEKLTNYWLSGLQPLIKNHLNPELIEVGSLREDAAYINIQF
jgi:hypothetical protein